MITYAFWTISKKFSISPKQFGPIKKQYYYPTRAIITRFWLETTLDYNPRILGPNWRISLFSTQIVCNINCSTI